LHRKLEPWLLLPTSAYVLAFIFAVLSVALPVVAGCIVPETYLGVADRDSTEARCEKRPELPSPSASTRCGEQLRNRKNRLDGLGGEIEMACDRWRFFTADLKKKSPPFNPATRLGLRDEEAAIKSAFNLWRGLAGGVPTTEARHMAWSLVVTLLVGMGVTMGASRHARFGGIPRLHTYRSVRLPIGASAAAISAVAAYLTYRESLDPQKTGYDWESYCLSGVLQIGNWSSTWAPGWSFWLAHASLGVLSLLVALQIGVGWHLTSPLFVPEPDPWKPGWGLRSAAG
jgi:hypothetical protein